MNPEAEFELPADLEDKALQSNVELRPIKTPPKAQNNGDAAQGKDNDSDVETEVNLEEGTISPTGDSIASAPQTTDKLNYGGGNLHHPPVPPSWSQF